MVQKESWTIIALDPIAAWLATLNDNAVDKIYAAINILKYKGSDLGRPVCGYTQRLEISQFKRIACAIWSFRV
ncbi:MAG: hypothetical protein IIU35_02315 [Neisseriaceae bacterium]|nr:hypothetical protein [Neisseriaceae bacterium]